MQTTKSFKGKKKGGKKQSKQPKSVERNAEIATKVRIKRLQDENDRRAQKLLQVTVPQATNSNLKVEVTVECLFDFTALNLAYASWFGFYASKGLFTESIIDDNEADRLVGGMGYMMQYVTQQINSSTQVATRAPEMVLDLIAALQTKNLNFLTYGKLTYAWQGTQIWANNPVITTVYGNWVPLIVFGDNNDYDSPAIQPSGPAAYTAENYNYLLSKITSINAGPKTTVRETTAYKSPLQRDVSSFARSYVYNGLQPSQAGGYYKDIENEVNITAPMYSAFSQYADANNKEARVPLKLQAFAGDAALAAGWSLSPTFVSFFNKKAPSFKCIDFDWICFTLTTWFSRAIEQLVNPDLWPAGQTLPMTFQDFRIVLRQALLNVFDSQYMLQFTGPLGFGTNENGFVPFMVNGNSYGSQMFQGFLLPELLQENLAALKARSIRTTREGKSKINTQTFFPVIGHYVLDTIPIPQYRKDGISYDLFLNTPQDPINLINGNKAQNNYINLNSSYYQTCLANWNENVQSLKAVTASLTNIMGDAGPLGLGILYYSSVVNTVEQTFTGAPVRVKQSGYLDYIANSKTVVPKQLTKIDSKKNVAAQVQALPAATLTTMTQVFTTSAIPPSSEMQSLLDTLIVPVIRVDPNGTTDQLSLQMYQIETKEPISSKYAANLNYGGGGIVSRLGKLADLCITGVGHEVGGEYDRVLQQLKSFNKAGMLSGLLGGLAKTFLPPDVHGIVDTVADILPF